MGTCIIILGSILALVFGITEARTYTLQELYINLTHWAFIGYLMVYLCLFVGLYLFNRNYTKDSIEVKVVDSTTWESEELISVCVEASSDTVYGSIRNWKSDISRRLSSGLSSMSARLSNIYSVSFSVFAGMLAAISILCFKMILELIKSTIEGRNQFNSFGAWVVLVVAIFLGFGQVHYINVALKNFDQLIVVPSFSVSLEVFSIIEGLVFFQDWKRFRSSFHVVMFTFGILLSFLGVGIAASGRKQSSSKELEEPFEEPSH